MMKLLPLVSAILAASTSVRAITYGLGTSWSIGFNTNASIAFASTTLNPGTPPTGQQGELILWPGVSNGTGNLLLSSIESWEDPTWCGAQLGEWCLRTESFIGQRAAYGALPPLAPNIPVTFTFTKNSDGSGWTSALIVEGKTVSELVSPLGNLNVFGIATECTDYCSMETSSLTYTNTTIILEEADPSFAASAVAGNTIYGDGTINTSAQKTTVVNGFESDADGKTFTVAEIVVPALAS